MLANEKARQIKIKLNDVKIGRIYITKGLTKSESEKHKILRGEARETREKCGNRDSYSKGNDNKENGGLIKKGTDTR